MPRNNSEEISAADSFYDDNIMPLSAERFMSRYSAKKKEYDLMFVTVGTSWQPVALSIMVTNPKRVIFLLTEGVEKELTKVLSFMKQQGRELIQYERVIVDKASSRDLINSVRNIYDRYNLETVCFDITGGTKAMVASAAMISASLNIDIFYIESNYLPVYRHPEPGSERLMQLERPQDI